MDKVKKLFASENTATEKSGEFFTEPIKLPRLKRSAMKITEGYLPHIVFDYRSGRWTLNVNQLNHDL
jgi:hypothetical protein